MNLAPDLSLVSLKNSVKVHSAINTIYETVLAAVRAIPQYELLKDDLEFLLHICNLVENATQKQKLDKKELVMRVFSTLFGKPSPEDLAKLASSIDFFANNKQIKLTSTSKIVLSKLTTYVSKQI